MSAKHQPAQLSIIYLFQFGFVKQTHGMTERFKYYDDPAFNYYYEMNVITTLFISNIV